MEKKKPRGTFYLIIVLAIIATILLIWRLFFFQEPLAPTLAEPTPTPSPAVVREQEGQGETPQTLYRDLKEDFPLVEFIPFDGPDFSLDYIGKLHLEARLAADTAANRRKVLDWIWDKGVNPATHQINWVTATPAP